MKTDDPKDAEPTPLPDSPTPTNSMATPPVTSEMFDVAMKRIARLLGRQIARGVFEAQRAANDNITSSEDQS